METLSGVNVNPQSSKKFGKAKAAFRHRDKDEELSKMLCNAAGKPAWQKDIGPVGRLMEECFTHPVAAYWRPPFLHRRNPRSAALFAENKFAGMARQGPGIAFLACGRRVRLIAIVRACDAAPQE